MKRMAQDEIDAAARKILVHLVQREEAQLLALHEAWVEDERSFYMGLGTLILRHQIRLEERGGMIWVIQGGIWKTLKRSNLSAALRAAASRCSPCREGFMPEGNLACCGTCPRLLEFCPSGGLAQLILAA
jgi:hypothetical protein